MSDTASVFCPYCKRTVEHKHMHDTAHGVSGTHMAGTERYECILCGHSWYVRDAERLKLKFVLDKPP